MHTYCISYLSVAGMKLHHHNQLMKGCLFLLIVPDG